MVGGMEITTKDLEAALPYLSQTGHYELQIAVLSAQKNELLLQLSQARHALSVMEQAVQTGGSDRSTPDRNADTEPRALADHTESHQPTTQGSRDGYRV